MYVVVFFVRLTFFVDVLWLLWRRSVPLMKAYLGVFFAMDPVRISAGTYFYWDLFSTGFQNVFDGTSEYNQHATEWLVNLKMPLAQRILPTFSRKKIC